MKVSCPSCRTVIPAGDLSLDAGWGKCAQCDEVFELEGLIPGYERPDRGAARAAAVERPFDAVVLVRRDRDVLLIHRPAAGMRVAHMGLLVFATFWTGFVAFWTVGALGMFDNNGPPDPARVVFAAFSTPFWVVGFVMLGSVAWMNWGKRTVRIDPSEMHTEMRCLFYRRRKRLERDQVQFARESRSMVGQNQSETGQVYGAEIIYQGGSFRVPCDTQAEQDWLLPEINSFLKSVPYRSGMSQVDPQTPLWSE